MADAAQTLKSVATSTSATVLGFALAAGIVHPSHPRVSFALGVAATVLTLLAGLTWRLGALVEEAVGQRDPV